MIKTFSNKQTEKVFNREHVPKFPSHIHKRAKKKLLLIDAAVSLDDLAVPPGNRLEQLSGNRLGEWSIRINKQWRICFSWHEGNAYDVEITDYH